VNNSNVVNYKCLGFIDDSYQKAIDQFGPCVSKVARV